VADSYTTETAHNYVLETVIYNLDETDEKKQLVAVVTSKIEEPDSASIAAEQYVKAITKSFDDK
jgi:rRNA processing protein Krr1/Pno1